ncbi:MAG: hypothetical protein NTW93_02470 [Phycisphaerae bacterium]|nr:hypothetical protein [Phycisphaerae bacterium]
MKKCAIILILVVFIAGCVESVESQEKRQQRERAEKQVLAEWRANFERLERFKAASSQINNQQTSNGRLEYNQRPAVQYFQLQPVSPTPNIFEQFIKESQQQEIQRQQEFYRLQQLNQQNSLIHELEEINRNLRNSQQGK